MTNAEEPQNPADTTPDAPPRRGPVERVYAEDEAPVERGTRAPGERRQTPRPA